MANLLDAKIIADRGNTIVELHGEIDIASKPELRKLFDDLADQENERIIVSLAQCTYCDSTVLGLLVALKERVTSRLRVVVPSDSPIRRVFDVTGLSNHFGLIRVGR
jgi:anti-sigma B factor antagonist